MPGSASSLGSVVAVAVAVPKQVTCRCCRWMVKVYIITLSELCKRLPTAFTQSVIGCQLIWVSCLFDVWSVASEARRGKLSHFNKAHSFLVKKNENGVQHFGQVYTVWSWWLWLYCR